MEMKLSPDLIKSIKDRAADDFLTDLGIMLNLNTGKFKHFNSIADLIDTECARDILEIKAEAYRNSFNYYCEASLEDQVKIINHILFSMDVEAVTKLLAVTFIDRYPEEAHSVMKGFVISEDQEGAHDE